MEIQEYFWSITFHLKVWSHFDAGSCPGSAIGVRCRLDNTVSGFIHTKNISDKNVKDPSERVQVSKKSNVPLNKQKKDTQISLFLYQTLNGWWNALHGWY